jgi:hypothetical protein
MPRIIWPGAQPIVDRLAEEAAAISPYDSFEARPREDGVVVKWCLDGDVLDQETLPWDYATLLHQLASDGDLLYVEDDDLGDRLLCGAVRAWEAK